MPAVARAVAKTRADPKSDPRFKRVVEKLWASRYCLPAMGGVGVRALFAGPSGTGKTLAARPVLAR